MKRYRAIAANWDGRAVLLKSADKGTVVSLNPVMVENIKQIRAQLVQQYGLTNFEQKLENFKESGYLNMSIVTEHNQLLRMIRDSHVSMYYYPSLVASCALGERILNDLVLKMRRHLAPSNDRITTKEAFTNWELMTEYLLEHNLISSNDEKRFFELKELRTFSIHYDKTLLSELKMRSASALEIVSGLIHSLFDPEIPEQYRIAGLFNPSFIRKDMENHPFIREYFLPCCIYVGPKHQITDMSCFPWGFKDAEYEPREISDEEYKALFVKT
jgi:hypothetical protein